MVEVALMILWKTVLVAVHEPAPTLYPQQTHLSITIETSFSILLLPLQHKLLYLFALLLLLFWTLGRKCFVLLFVGFLLLRFPKIRGEELEAGRAKTLVDLGTVEGLTLFAEVAVG